MNPLEPAIRDVFLESGIEPFSQKIQLDGALISLRFRLPEVVEQAAELMREVLLRGCVVPERAKLVFQLYEKPVASS